VNLAFRTHEAYLDQAWRTLKDSILLKMPPNQYGEQPQHSTYHVYPEIWQEAGGARAGESHDGPHQMWTIHELEEKLGRKLTPDAFTTSPVNWERDTRGHQRQARRFFPKEEAIIQDRLGGKEGMDKLRADWVRSRLGSTRRPQTDTAIAEEMARMKRIPNYKQIVAQEKRGRRLNRNLRGTPAVLPTFPRPKYSLGQEMKRQEESQV